MNFPENLLLKLTKRKENGEYRFLKTYSSNSLDFFSNDYLGIVQNYKPIKESELTKINRSGATGSRLISGNSDFYNSIENYLAEFYKAETALLFGSGYMANIGLISSLALLDDIIIFDEYVHASLRDGINLSKAKSAFFKHNDLLDLENQLKKINNNFNVYVIIESLYSMDGDFGLLIEINTICEKYDAYLIIDEAHSTGVYGQIGEGISPTLKLSRLLASIHTFGKGIGTHGAVVVGSKDLKDYLINFCRTFIYTTGLSDFMLNHIKICHELVKKSNLERINLANNIAYFKNKIEKNKLNYLFINSNSPIQGIIATKEKLKEIENHLLLNLINIKAIYSPSVPRGKERIRISLHSFNTFKEIDLLFKKLLEII